MTVNESPILHGVSGFAEEMRAWRHRLHANPELGFEEVKTAAFVAEQLAAFGCEVHTGIAGTGVVGVLRAGTSGRAIALRADMDALPIEEASQVPHRSTSPGLMHACGHDGHTTMLLGAAKYLASTRNFDGTVNFVFQPAEEGRGGAAAMIAEGLFERFPADAIYGLHNRPGLPTGKFSIRGGPMMAGAAFFSIVLTGHGTHAARPETGVDTLLAACHVATALQSIVARNIKATDSVVLSVTQIHAGTADNIIPARAELRGTVRAFQRAQMDLVGSRMTALAQQIAAGFGAAAEVEFKVLFEPVVNDPAEATVLADAAASLFGEESVDRARDPVMGSDDIGAMLGVCRGAHMYVGNGDAAGHVELHNPAYDFNDELLPLGAAYLVQVVESRLRRS